MGVASQGSPGVRLHSQGVPAGGAREEVLQRGPHAPHPPHSAWPELPRGTHPSLGSLGAAGRPASGDHPPCRPRRRLWMLPFVIDPNTAGFSEPEELDGARDLCPDFQALAQENCPGGWPEAEMAQELKRTLLICAGPGRIAVCCQPQVFSTSGCCEKENVTPEYYIYFNIYG